ncbi:alpha/beta hydrolase [Bergeriella denitrificans]|uniref:Acetyl esterase n=1 Tax=Bergeriella denitrificans TaxID=494 RepID=A0A378UF90_BERDE|nr:alpha/beta hydrolase [Bergeriella denitrificans]STZ75413.1 acetyl esterase [Bergeriella denitrificans]
MKFLKTFALYASAFAVSFAVGFSLNLVMSRDTSMTVSNWSDEIGTISRDFAYGDKAAQKFDLYLPADKSRAHYGLVVYLHAGGFTAGDKTDDTEILKWFAAQGYVGAGIGYTLLSEQNPTASVKSMSDEIKTAMPIVVAKAKELGYPIDKMAVGGGSAGHGLAAIYAFRDGNNAPVPIAFTFGMVGPTSFEMDGAPTEPNAEAAAMLSALSGEAISVEMLKSGDYQDKIKPIEAYRWVGENSVPTLAAFGAQDKVMPFSTKPFQTALAAHNVPHDVIIFEKSGHGMHRDKDKQKLYVAKLNEYLAKYLPVK